MSASLDTPMTLLLDAVARGESGSNERLWAVVYDELHRLARQHMAREGDGRTLQTTALVHEAFVRLGGHAGAAFANRRHFFAAAAKAMRRILVDDARRRGRAKRGGGLARVLLGDIPVGDGPPAAVDFLALDEALAGLAATEPHLAEVVNLRYFAGLSIDETAESLGVSPRKIDRDWQIARAWLHRALAE